MHTSERTANLLGAAALTLTDLLLTAGTKAAGASASGAAALVVLSASPGLSVTELGRRVGLSQSAGARMIDSLQADGLVQRIRGQAGSVSVRPTRAGRQTARRLLTARGGPLTEVVGGLDIADQRALAGLLDKLLTRLYDEVGSAELICRLCDRGVCTAGTATCPVGAAERARGH